MIRTFKRLWCRAFHRSRSMMWPIHGTYQCRRCAERFEDPALDGPAPRKANAALVEGPLVPRRDPL